eukprot:545854-Hanusia_phi.AAC.1
MHLAEKKGGWQLQHRAKVRRSAYARHLTVSARESCCEWSTRTGRTFPWSRPSSRQQRYGDVTSWAGAGNVTSWAGAGDRGSGEVPQVGRGRRPCQV